MAIYKDDLPSGIDLQFNTNKSDTGNKLDAMKPNETKQGAINQFGSAVRPLIEYDSQGKKTVTSSMNIVYGEGQWANWQRTISSQVLSKQSPKLAKAQLAKRYDEYAKNYNEIMALTNPTVRKYLLKPLAEQCDRSAVKLEAAALSRKQGWHVILPISTLSPNQVYAPNYDNGERVVLIRHPHGGTFEIPELIVNNNHPEAKKLLGDVRDAIGIHPDVAQRLSGADFDGDTVIVIPNKSNRIKTTHALEQLKNFDPRALYKLPDSVPRISENHKNTLMGDVSNLITDMTIKGAPPADIARAIKHSMVVIDCEKHHLNYKQSAIDNGIPALKERYQGGAKKGASTLISLAGSKIWVDARKERPARLGGPIDKQTGELKFVPTGEMRINKQGKEEPRQVRTKRLAETNDAMTLVSEARGPIEMTYVEHSNKLKALANEARKQHVNTPRLKYYPSAAQTYANEVKSLNASLSLAKANAPLERQAQVIAHTIVKMKREANPNLDEDSIKKITAQALNEARARTGANKKAVQIKLTDREWEAIQSGAISDSKLIDILKNSDLDSVRKLATPHQSHKLSSTISSIASSIARCVSASERVSERTAIRAR